MEFKGTGVVFEQICGRDIGVLEAVQNAACECGLGGVCVCAFSAAVVLAATGS